MGLIGKCPGCGGDVMPLRDADVDWIKRKYGPDACIPDSRCRACGREPIEYIPLRVKAELRDQFAAAALQGILAGPAGGNAVIGEGRDNDWRLARTTYEIADAMMEARVGKPKGKDQKPEREWPALPLPSEVSREVEEGKGAKRG